MKTTYKISTALLLTVALTGCVSFESAGRAAVKNSKTEGVFYGAGWADAGDATKVCEAIQNGDPRCNNPQDWVPVSVVSRMEYWAGSIGGVGLLPKNHADVEKLRHRRRTGNADSTYVKARTNLGRLADIEGVVSYKDGKCHWSGMPGLGATVCEVFNYDADRDYGGVVNH